jgi:hypothetical protein
MMMSPHLFFGPNAPGLRDVTARAEAAREHERANDPTAAARNRRDEALRAFPDRARKLAARGLPVAAPRGFEEAFELRAHLQRTCAAEVESRIAAALRPAERGGSAAARLARADAALADLRRPRNFAGASAPRGGDRRSPSPHDSRARAERALFRSLLEKGLARTPGEAARMVVARGLGASGGGACFA